MSVVRVPPAAAGFLSKPHRLVSGTDGGGVVALTSMVLEAVAPAAVALIVALPAAMP